MQETKFNVVVVEQCLRTLLLDMERQDSGKPEPSAVAMRLGAYPRFRGEHLADLQVDPTGKITYFCELPI